MRLNKYISQAGLVSRRKADELVEAGKVKINGKLHKELGYLVKDTDVVTVLGEVIKPNIKKVYYILNKPKGYITTAKDEQDRPTVMELVMDIEERIFPVGRLDNNTSGLLLMTNDGDFAYKMMHPKHEVYKTYVARINGHITKANADKIRTGVDIGGHITSPAELNILKEADRSTIVEIKITEGKNRQVRKMFASVGNKVIDLERVAIGDLRLGHIKAGHYRKLNQKDLESLQ